MNWNEALAHWSQVKHFAILSNGISRVLRGQGLHGIERKGVAAPSTPLQVQSTWPDARPKIGAKKADFALDKRVKTLTCDQWL